MEWIYRVPRILLQTGEVKGGDKALRCTASILLRIQVELDKHRDV